MIFLNQNDKNGIKTHIILIQVLFDPLLEECRVQSLRHLRVNNVFSTVGASKEIHVYTIVDVCAST